jgi:hypothetical protein
MTYEIIEMLICLGEGFTAEEIKAETRKGEIVYARQLIMYFSADYKTDSYAVIAGELGLDHATVNHAIKVITNYIDTDKVKCAKINNYRRLLDKLSYFSQRAIDLEKMLSPLEKEISELEQRVLNLTIQIGFLKNSHLLHDGKATIKKEAVECAETIEADGEQIKERFLSHNQVEEGKQGIQADTSALCKM